MRSALPVKQRFVRREKDQRISDPEWLNPGNWRGAHAHDPLADVIERRIVAKPPVHSQTLRHVGDAAGGMNPMGALYRMTTPASAHIPGDQRDLALDSIPVSPQTLTRRPVHRRSTKDLLELNWSPC